MSQVHEVKNGKATRMSFSGIKEVVDLPDLIDIQKQSYEWFLKSGLKDVLNDASPITDFSGNLMLEFVDYRLEDETKYTIEEAKARNTSYSSRLQVQVRLFNKETGEIKEQEIFLCDLPVMTESGTFLINGAERVIISQLARVDRTRKVPITTLIRALGVQSDQQIMDLFEDDLINENLYKDPAKTQDEALLEIYKKIRPNEPLHAETAKSLLFGLLFEPRRYDLSRVGRYKYNKKLSIAERTIGEVAAENVITEDGEILVSAGETISEEVAYKIKHAGINVVYIDREGKKIKIIGNNTVDISTYLGMEIDKDVIKEEVYLPALKELLEKVGDVDEKELKKQIRLNREKLVIKCATIDDIMSSINYFMNLRFGLGSTDDIDHLGNRRVRCVGELLQNQFRIGLARLERVVRERMATQDLDVATPQTLINIKPVVGALREFFGSSQLSQFMDQINPLAELTHKRRISALGPGGLSRERAGFEVRDVHHTHYGRLCPIESPEGPNIGLISSLSTYAKINRYGFVETPYRLVDKKTGVVTNEIKYMTADEEDKYIVAQANEPLDAEGRFVNKRIKVRYRDLIEEIEADKVDLMDVSPKDSIPRE